ncbi:phospholipid-binding lipoprotein MlaA [Gammaproteobacteria bacterium]
MRPLTVSLLTLTMTVLVGCASGPDHDPRDPWELLNRAVDSFNNTVLDRALKPIAEFYSSTLPSPVTESVANFFSNLGGVLVTTNDFLQFKVEQGLQDGVRLVYNTTFGLLGLFDVASAWDIPKHNEDFGQTLGYWGIDSGPYLVLPFFGPRTVRDTVGLVADSAVDPVYRIEPDRTHYGTVALRVIDTRANLLGAGRVLDEAALDRYLFVRDAYLQRRDSLVHDGRRGEETIDNYPDQPDRR